VRTSERARRIILYKNQTGRVGRCSCCRRRCHPLTTVVVLHVFERAQCFVVAGAGAGFDATNHAADVKGRGGGDRVPRRCVCVCVCARALFSRKPLSAGVRGGEGSERTGARRERTVSVFGRVTRAIVSRTPDTFATTVHGSEFIPRPGEIRRLRRVTATTTACPAIACRRAVK